MKDDIVIDNKTGDIYYRFGILKDFYEIQEQARAMFLYKKYAD